MEETIAYVLTLLNAVDLNYRQAKEPEVRLNIAGIVIVNVLNYNYLIIIIV